MRALEPPAAAWLMRHEVRLGWRAVGPSRRFFAGAGALLWAGMHWPAWHAMRASQPSSWLERAPALAIAVQAFVFFLMVSWAFGLAVRAIFDRGDLDLLASAPVPAMSVYSVRAGYVALGSVAMVLFLGAPFVDAAALQGHAAMLLAYPVILALGLAAAAIAFAATLALARALGVQRARSVAQILGVAMGAAFVIASQAQAVLPASARGAVAAWFASASGRSWLGRDSPLAWPLRAMTGEVVPALGVIAAGVALFVLVLACTSRAFIDAASRGGEVPMRTVRRGSVPRAFRSGIARVVVAKELRLIARDPLLIAKSLLQVLYLVPLLALSAQHNPAWRLVAPAVVVIVANLAASLAWIARSAEEAPDLVASSPVPPLRIEMLKLAAGVAGPALLAMPFVVLYAFHSVAEALLLAVVAIAAMATSAAIEHWSARPAPRASLSARHKDNMIIGFVEAFAALGWGGACYLALGRNAFAFLALLMPAACLAIAWVLRRRDG